MTEPLFPERSEELMAGYVLGKPGITDKDRELNNLHNFVGGGMGVPPALSGRAGRPSQPSKL